MATPMEHFTPDSKTAAVTSEKGTATAVTEKPLDRSDSPSSTPSNGQHKNVEGGQKNMEGGLLDLLMGAVLPCVPVIVVTSLLLTLILYNQVEIDPGWPMLAAPTAGNLSNPATWNNSLMARTQRGGDAAYYVRYNPSTLAAIASWSSRIIPFLTGTSMAVVAFFASRRIMKATEAKQTNELPTPHQTSILIKLLSGSSAKPLYDTLVYRWNHHEPLVQPIPLAWTALASILVITFAISGADTWFAVATKPMNVELVTRHYDPSSFYGRDLNPAICNGSLWQERPCPANAQLQCKYPCNVENWNFTTGGGMAQKEGSIGAEESAKTLLSNSYTNLIQNVSNPPSYYSQQYYYLADIGIGQALDYMANTTAVQTQCQVVTQNCNISSTDENFTCGNYSTSLSFSGQVGSDAASTMTPPSMSSVGIQFFDANQQPIGFGNQSTNLFTTQNPMHFLTWSKGFPPVDTSTHDFDGMRNGNYLKIDHSGDNVFILNCTSTVYRVVYAWVNSSVLSSDNYSSQSFYPTVGPDTYGAIFSAPFAMDSALGHVALHNAAALAAYLTTPEGVAQKFANEFSRAAIALTAGVMIPTLSMVEQSRNNTELLTRVPKAPLYFLISLKALYALMSLTIVILAAFLTSPVETQEVKARLTVDGLAVGLFEPKGSQERSAEKIEDLYGEHAQAEQRKKRGEGELPGDQGVHKVGMKQVPTGGWAWIADGKLSGTWRV